MEKEQDAKHVNPSSDVVGARKLPYKYVILLIAMPIIVILDQWTKHWIHTRFRLHESVPVIQSCFSLTYIRNPGVAFGGLVWLPAWFREPFLVAVPLIAMIVIVFIYLKLNEKQLWSASALTLILAGALGNLIDRLRFKYVIDFLDFYWRDHHWPAFNVADSCIVVGVGIMLIQSFFGEEPSGNEAKVF